MASLLGDLARGTVSAMAGDDVRLTVETAGEAHLGIERAIPLALMVSELLTNAQKYAPGRRHGDGPRRGS